MKNSCRGDLPVGKRSACRTQWLEPMHRKWVMMQAKNACRWTVDSKGEDFVSVRRAFGYAQGRLNQIAAATARMMSSTSMSPQFAYQKCSALTSRQKINEFINQRRIPVPDRPA
jgi:hypothetical protein